MRQGYRDDLETGKFAGERMFSSRVELRYVLEEATERPDALIVAFSAAQPSADPPRYYTLRALRAIRCHRLFVLDDRGPGGLHSRPSWYLGRNRSTDVPDSVRELINEVARELGLARNRVVTCGASKGGWAALYFAARFGAGHAVVGEPQAFLGQHLMQEGTYDIAAHVAGGTSGEDTDFLDELLFDAFRTSEAPPSVHVYCGRGSPYYAHDVLPLIGFLDGIGISTELELGYHSNHVPDLGLHFPGYLTRRLNELLGTPSAGSPASASR